MNHDLTLAFTAARAKNRALLIGYLPVGFPTPQAFASLVETAAEGLDALELGLPCQDPFMDGQIIRQAMTRVLQAGIDMAGAFDLIEELRSKVAIPLIAMAYWQSVQQYGSSEFLQSCHRASISAILIPDVPEDLLGALCRQVEDLGMAMVGFLQHPRAVAAFLSEPPCRPAFYYLRSSAMTGEAVDLTQATAGLAELRRLLNGAETPVALGFGIQAPEELAALAAAGADGLVVGTVLVRAAAHGPAALRRTVTALARATQRGE